MIRRLNASTSLQKQNSTKTRGEFVSNIIQIIQEHFLIIET